MRELDLTTGTVRRFGQAFPIYVALNASDEFTGRGVTLAVLDSAFVPHPDLSGRIVAYHDASGEELPLDAPLEGRHWHGSMTAVVAAGNGLLSDGLYRSLAPNVSVALVKVGGLATLHLGIAFWAFVLLVLVNVLNDNFMCRLTIWRTLDHRSRS